MKEFIKEYKALCKKHGFMIQADDHFCGIEITPLEGNEGLQEMLLNKI